MKFREVVRYEIAYQVRHAWPWLIFAVLLVFAFLFTRDGSLADALRDDFFLNSPFVILGATVAGGLIWLLVGAVVAGEAAARDVAVDMYPLLYTAPVSKVEYLGGRFLAALLLNAAIWLALPLGNLLAVHLPGVHPAVVGPFRPAAYLTAYAFIALPNAFVATAVQFLPAARSGRPMAGYLGSLLLFFMSYILGLFLYIQGRPDLASLLDPIGVHFILSDLSRLWTPIEKSTRLLALEGTVLTNRLLWLAVALAAIALTYLLFRFAHRSESSWWGRGRQRGRNTPASPSTGARVTAPALSKATASQATSRFGFAIQARQMLAIAWTSFRAIATSWAGLALLVALPLLAIPVVIDQMDVGGVSLVPTTALVIGELTAPLSDELSRWVIVPLLIVFFTGELIWRERDAGMGEIADAMPVPEWVPFIGKFLGLALALALFMVFLMIAGVVAQAILGYDRFEIGLYLRILLGLQLPEYLLFAMLAFVVHVLVDQKYIGHLAAIIAYVMIILASMFGIEHDLLIYGAGPGWSYTEMRGFGPSLGPWMWFKLYWAAWALLLAVAARLLWVRGRAEKFGMRLRLARRRFTGSTFLAGGVALGLILALGGFIFYHTNVLNEYRTASGIAEQQAEYERRFGQYADVPQPRLTGTNLHVEIYPEAREVDIRGSYELVNRSSVAIDTLHLATAPEVRTGAVTSDPPSTLTLADEKLGHRIYALETPLRPGASLRLDFQVHVEPRGFTESGMVDSIVANGTYFTNGWLPAIGYQPWRELTSAAERRAHGLPPRPLIPSLYDVEAASKGAEAIAFDAVIGTHEKQIAVAPGALRRTWTEDGRRYFHYSTDGPIGNEWAFFSADYALHVVPWRERDGAGKSVTIRIYYHPSHTINLERMSRSIRASMDYYSRHFGTYPYSHLTVIEHPGNGTGMHADPTIINFSEGAALFNPSNDPDSLDLPFAIIAHEMAHQWTVPYAPVEGAPVMSESLAWYYGMRVVDETLGRDHLQRLLSFMREPYPYPPIRRGEPLLRGLDPYLSYRKGPFALHALSEYIGVEQVNLALRRLLENHRQAGAPLATTLDLYSELQAVTPESYRYLLHDLFEVNTFWELSTEQVTAEQSGSGDWQVTLNVRARKVVVDEAGVESEVPMDEMIPVGVFAPSGEGDELGEPLYRQKHRIRSGAQTITVTVPRRPLLAGIDPYHLLDWEELEDDDNIEEATLSRLYP